MQKHPGTNDPKHIRDSAQQVPPLPVEQQHSTAGGSGATGAGVGAKPTSAASAMGARKWAVRIWVPFVRAMRAGVCGLHNGLNRISRLAESFWERTVCHKRKLEVVEFPACGASSRRDGQSRLATPLRVLSFRDLLPRLAGLRGLRGLRGLGRFGGLRGFGAFRDWSGDGAGNVLQHLGQVGLDVAESFAAHYWRIVCVWSRIAASMRSNASVISEPASNMASATSPAATRSRGALLLAQSVTRRMAAFLESVTWDMMVIE